MDEYIQVPDWTLFPHPLILRAHGVQEPEYEEPYSPLSMTHTPPPPPPQAFVDIRGSDRLPITRNTIIYGDGETATGAVEVISDISQHRNTSSKAVFEVLSNGRRCVAKCWAPDRFQEYAIEAYVYDMLDNNAPNVPNCFATRFSSGQVMCSSKFPAGYILILQKRRGVPVTEVFDHLEMIERMDLIQLVRRGIAFLQRCEVQTNNANFMDDILFDRDSGETTMLDFISSRQEIGWDAPITVKEVADGGSEVFVIGDDLDDDNDDGSGGGGGLDSDDTMVD